MMAGRNYQDIFQQNADEKIITELAAESLEENRIGVKAQGYEVSSLSKMQKLRNKLADPGSELDLQAEGLNFAEHPELAELGGEVDPNTVVLPESEALERSSNDPKLQNKLRARMAAKMGMSQYISENAMKEEYRKKMRARIEPEQPRIRPTNAPRFTPKNRPY